MDALEADASSAAGPSGFHRLVAHAIVSSEGRIAAADGTMPPCLIVPADQRRFQGELSAAALTVLGREGHERHPVARPRLVLTSRVAALERDGTAWLWNPAGASLADALARGAPEGGTVVVAGGGRTMALMLPRLDALDLAVAETCAIPGGRPCVEGAESLHALRERIAGAGLVGTDMPWLDEARRVRLWRYERAQSARAPVA